MAEEIFYILVKKNILKKESQYVTIRLTAELIGRLYLEN